jgi:hypothetical protein
MQVQLTCGLGQEAHQRRDIEADVRHRHACHVEQPPHIRWEFCALVCTQGAAIHICMELVPPGRRCLLGAESLWPNRLITSPILTKVKWLMPIVVIGGPVDMQSEQDRWLPHFLALILGKVGISIGLHTFRQADEGTVVDMRVDESP